MHSGSRPILGLSTIQSAAFLQLFCDYHEELVRAAYSRISIRLHLHAVAHFGIWLEREGIEFHAIDEETLAEFERHRPSCKCPSASRNRARQVGSCVRVFLRYSRRRGVVRYVEGSPELAPVVGEFLGWMKAQRGSTETTLASYRLYVSNLIEVLGDDPQKYTARGLRDFISKRYRHYGSNSIRMVLAAVRMFIRYLAIEGRCRSGLEHALISPARWSQQSLPRGLSSEEIRRVLKACRSTTTRGLRDRAILLLMIRLGLRAGDVAGLRLSDLCFGSATIRVTGKGRREVRLPLPQDVGDALLKYLEGGRPKAENEHVFLRSMAPIEPFASGHGVTHIARVALERAGVEAPTRGAHVFRHTAACQMLRQDVGLEGIADVLRHRSIETTALYAKVDLHLLEQVAQPWPEEASSC